MDVAIWTGQATTGWTQCGGNSTETGSCPRGKAHAWTGDSLTSEGKAQLIPSEFWLWTYEFMYILVYTSIYKFMLGFSICWLNLVFCIY